MTSKIKVDNIENQCGGAVVTKCGGTTTISGTVVKSNTLQASDAGNIISQSGTTITLGASGDTINLASGASQSGFGRTGTVDWDTTPKTATFSAVSGNGYFCNTSGGAFTVNLPAGSAGAIVSLADYAATWQTNVLTVSANGSEKIGGNTNDVALSTEGQSVTLVYVDSTQGWINTMDSTSNVRGVNVLTASVSGACNTLVTAPCCANVKIATFTGPGNFTVTNVSDVAAENTVGYMIVAGGGGGGAKNGSFLSNFENGAGGGAGGFREGRNVPIDNFTASPLVANAPTNAITVTAQTYPVVVGGGGAGSPFPTGSLAARGSLSSFGGITSAGGGGGGGNGGSSLTPGGSGGGEQNWGGGNNPTGNTPPVSPAQGFGGGASAQLGSGGGGPGGGGGAGELGHNGSGTSSGQGGVGVSNSITGSSVGRAGGGGGSSPGAQPGGSCGSGGNGGGNNPGGNGQTNRGGGGGGSGQCGASGSGGNGGSGIVIIRYKFQ